MSETNDTSGHVEPATEAAVHEALAELQKPAPAAPAPPSDPVDTAFKTHFTTLPGDCELPMRSIIEAARRALKVGDAKPTPAQVDAVFLAYFNSPPIACEAEMRPLIEAARKDLKG